MMLDGEWADVTRLGKVVRQKGTFASPLIGVGEITSIPVPEWLMCLRCDEGPLGLVIVGQGHESGKPYIWTSAYGWRTLVNPNTHGVFCLETDGISVWCVHAPTLATRYRVEDLSMQEILDPQGTSQGFLDCTDPALLWSDRASRVGDVLFPNRVGDWLVGKSPSQEENLVVAQRPNDVARIVARVTGFEPRVAFNNDGTIRMVTRTPTGVYVSDTNPLTWPPATPTVVESPVGTVVHNLWRFVTGLVGLWPRTGSHPMHCVTDTTSAFFIKFDNPNSWERWAPQGDYIYHVEDHSHDSGNPYVFSDGRWLKQTMAVGERISCSQNHIRWYRNGQWGGWSPFPYTMTLDAHRTYSDGHEEIVFTYDPGGDRDTREVYTCRSDKGWEMWDHYSQATGEHLQHSEWKQPHTVRPTPVNMTVSWPAPRPIVVSHPPIPPEKPTVPTVNFPPRNETLDFTAELNKLYKTEGNRPETPGIHVDMEGLAVWQQEYLRRRVNGESHASAQTAVLNEIRKIWGLLPPQ